MVDAAEVRLEEFRGPGLCLESQLQLDRVQSAILTAARAATEGLIRWRRHCDRWSCKPVNLYPTVQVMGYLHVLVAEREYWRRVRCGALQDFLLCGLSLGDSKKIHLQARGRCLYTLSKNRQGGAVI
jgi:hypothetical protein